MIKNTTKKIFELIKKRKILFIALFFIIGGVFFGSRSLASKNAPSYDVAPVQKQDLSLTISASGKVKSEEEVTLKFQTSGSLSWVGVKKGDRVTKWQAIASLDRRELEKKLKQELLDYMNERWDHEQIMLDDYRDIALTETIRRVKEKSQFDLDRVVLDVEIADIALKYSTLISPIDGLVIDIDTPHPGTNITPTTGQFYLANPDKMYFSANVDEADIGLIKENQLATLILDAYPEEEITSYVQDVEFTSTVTSGGGTAYAVKFALPNSTEEEKFKLGMNGDVEIFIEKRENVLAIPFEAVQENENGKYVFLKTENGFEQKEIKVGFSNDIYTQILEGLSEDDEIAISGFKELERKLGKSER
ncbi:hypothetical protein COT75_00435 [Candidatus Beckwithbacteria bacterium CG10_big_fil_rev_8_21_14_0_10_34_10]|uniref:CzcB-like C-terminal circularly permuted SH3-like domain-containing protein n=1 Tax=Candidatus Beckwithbacteria bacterium CG10_big_fil_rev_8_21_14_0_10_34_10 TaxID=1974495 RepID=A0A2H0WAG2_9BACT|nr:MAG: hypothetical protein COT75_00435 [Candidatus Beckwithbacteria bacterium CG10_big_fil_rev_8_21_14_0_10_34_10]